MLARRHPTEHLGLPGASTSHADRDVSQGCWVWRIQGHVPGASTEQLQLRVESPKGISVGKPRGLRAQEIAEKLEWRGGTVHESGGQLDAP